jgi:hypothetical protein
MRKKMMSVGTRKNVIQFRNEPTAAAFQPFSSKTKKRNQKLQKNKQRKQNKKQKQN